MTESPTTPSRADATRVRTTVNKPLLRGMYWATFFVTPFWGAVIALVVWLKSRG